MNEAKVTKTPGSAMILVYFKIGGIFSLLAPLVLLTSVRFSTAMFKSE